MNLLIAVASRHGSTLDIARAIAQQLRLRGHTVAVREVSEARDTGRYGAVIIGSAVYLGDWLPEARRFVGRNAEMLVNLPVWLFSSGPLGQEDPEPKGDPGHLDELLRATGGRGHRVFVGRLDRKTLRFGERLMAKAVHAPEGDFRDWEDVRAWADEIASALPAGGTTGAADPTRTAPGWSPGTMRNRTIASDD